MPPVADQPPDSAALAVQNQMFRALAVLRVLVLLNSLGLAVYRRQALEHPIIAAAILLGLTGWTGFATWAYAKPSRRELPLMATDLVVAVSTILVSPWVKGDEMSSTLPSYWVMSVVLAWAARWRWQGGLVASLAICTADVAIRDTITQQNYGNLFLVMVGGPLVGFLSGLLQQMAQDRDLAEREAAAAAERARLARVVHDGVLQVLALVQRRGAELGGEPAELGRLAGEQETALRALVNQDTRSERLAGGEDRDLAALVTRLEGRTTPKVRVAVPGEPVPVPRHVAEEVIAVVRACLHNVTDHVGEDARAWVLLENLGDRIEVSVRDEGPGIEPGRLERAAGEGRLGVSESIHGRIDGLGATATLSTAPGQGTEWEFSVPTARVADQGTGAVRR